MILVQPLASVMERGLLYLRALVSRVSQGRVAILCSIATCFTNLTLANVPTCVVQYAGQSSHSSIAT